MPYKNHLKQIIKSLRTHVENNTFSATAVYEATNKLAEINYKYDSSLFPELPPTTNWKVPPLDKPQSLAEALLWKMGKWKIYKSFVEHFDNSDSQSTSTDVVFYAFAKNLADQNKPIYDQHALRALWAIDTKLTPQQAKLCRNLLTKKKSGEWKPIASGVSAPDGYLMYVNRINDISLSGASLGDIDKLLMPLGQALKDHTKNVDDFLLLTGCAN